MIQVYANLVLNGAKTLDEVPLRFRLAVEALVEKMKQSNT